MPGEGRRWIGKQATRAPIHTRRGTGAGTHAGWETWQHGKPCRWRAHAKPVAREGRTGPAGWRTGRWCRGRRVTPDGERGLASGECGKGTGHDHWQSPIRLGKSSETPERTACESEGRTRPAVSRAGRQGMANGLPYGSLGRGLRRNGGSAGVDGETFRHSGASGVERWLGELSQDPGRAPTDPRRSGRFPARRGSPASSGRWAYPASGIGCGGHRPCLCLADIRGRPAAGAICPSTGTERDGRGETRPSAGDHRTPGGCGRRPVQPLRRNPARRAHEKCRPPRQRRSDARAREGMAGNADGGGRRGGRQAPHKPRPQGAERYAAGCAGPALSGQPCMRRFILGWKLPGHARRLSSEIVNYADDFRLPGKAQAAEMLPAVRQIMERPSYG